MEGAFEGGFGGVGKPRDRFAQIGRPDKDGQEHDCLANKVVMILPRYKHQRCKAQANARPRRQLAHSPQKYIEKDERVNEPGHGMAQQQVIEQISKLQIGITKYPVVLDALSPQLNGHPHRIRNEEKP